MTSYQRKLMNFGRQALLILEADKSWSADTTDAIAQVAYDFDLAHTTDTDEMDDAFTVKPDPDNARRREQYKHKHTKNEHS